MQDIGLARLPNPQRKHLLEPELATTEVPAFSIIEFELWVARSDSDGLDVDAV